VEVVLRDRDLLTWLTAADAVRWAGEAVDAHHRGELVAPARVYADFGEGRLVFTTGRDTSKGRALARDSRVVICVDDPHPPYSFVQVQGVAVVSEDPQDVLDFATRTGARYMGADRADEFGRRNAVAGEVVVRVQPTKINSAFDVAD